MLSEPSRLLNMTFAFRIDSSSTLLAASSHWEKIQIFISRTNNPGCPVLLGKGEMATETKMEPEGGKQVYQKPRIFPLWEQGHQAIAPWVLTTVLVPN